MALVAVLALGLVPALCSGRLTAQEQARQAFFLDYSAPSECPTAEDSVGQLRTRTNQLVLTNTDDRGLVLTVRVLASDGPFFGWLVLREPDGRITERRIDGHNCRELISALALAAAVMADAGASTRSTYAPATTEPRPRPKPAPRHPPAARRTQAEPWRLGVQGGGYLQDGIAPEPLLGWAVQVELLPHSKVVKDLRFSVALLQAASDPIVAHGGVARLTHTSARLSGCWPAWPAESAANFRPCLSMDVGTLHGEAQQVADATSSTGLWLAPGLLAHWELSSGALVLSADGGVVFPILRHRFFYSPDATVYQVPAYGPTGTVTAGLRFP